MSDMKMKVLVVDDDEALRDVISKVLEKKFDVRTASSGNVAIEMLKNDHYELVFSDVCMPDGNGIELLDWIARQPSRSVVVLVTGHSMIAPEDAVAKGAHSVIAKPFRASKLLAVAQEVAANLPPPAP